MTTTTVLDAVVHKQCWKNDVITRYVSALLQQARRLHGEGIVFFNNDDVPDVHQPGDKTTVGAAFKLMIHEDIIEPFRGSVAAQEIWGGYRKSSRKCNNGHKNQLYQLTSTAIADAWLTRHGYATEARQLALFGGIYE